MSRRRSAGGFTLVEALVAITLLALLSGSLMPLFQQGLAVLERGDRRTRAAMLARSLLEEHTVPVPAESVGVKAPASGSDGGFRWQVTREPYDPSADGGPVPDDTQESPYSLVRVSARVQWDGGADGVRVSTLVMERSP